MSARPDSSVAVQFYIALDCHFVSELQISSVVSVSHCAVSVDDSSQGSTAVLVLYSE